MLTKTWKLNDHGLLLIHMNFILFLFREKATWNLSYYSHVFFSYPFSSCYILTFNGTFWLCVLVIWSLKYWCIRGRKRFLVYLKFGRINKWKMLNNIASLAWILLQLTNEYLRFFAFMRLKTSHYRSICVAFLSTLKHDTRTAVLLVLCTSNTTQL